MRLFALPACSLSLAVLLSACGPSTQVNTDVNGDMRIPTNDGTVSTGQTLRADWPTDAPTYPDAIVQYSASVNPTTGKPGASAVFVTKTGTEEVATFYAIALAENGWTVDTTMLGADSTIMTATKDNRTLSLAIAASQGQTSITLAIEAK